MISEESVTDKKEKFIRIGICLVAVALIGFAVWLFSGFYNEKIASPVPTNYKFMVADHYTKSGTNWATYYVYDSQILVQKDDANGNHTDDPIMAYDNVDTSELELDESDTTRICDTDSCYSCPKALVALKQLIANKYWREYTGH